MAHHRENRGWLPVRDLTGSTQRTAACRHRCIASTAGGRHRALPARAASRTHRTRPSLAAVLGGMVVAGLMTLLVPAAEANDPSTTLGTAHDRSAAMMAVGSSADLRAPASAVGPGAAIEISAAGFLPGSTVAFGLDDEANLLGVALVGGTGVARLHATLPAQSEGLHRISSSGTGLLGELRTLSQPLTVHRAEAPVSAGFDSAVGRAFGFAGIAALFALWLLAAGPGRARWRAARGGAHR